ncbi:MAG: hypothetical protein AAGD10_04130 [Myxococcota bacterium]
MADPNQVLLATLVGARRLVDQPDSGLDELPSFVQGVRDRMNDEGYAMGSSLGAYLITVYANELVPTGLSGLRRTPLEADKLAPVLALDGGDPLLGWTGAPDVFAPTSEMDPNLLAGLIERSLTPGERESALNQVAYGLRDSAWAGAAAGLLHHVRMGLAIWPADRDPALQVTAVSLREADRARRVQLLEGASSMRGRMLGRLAHSEERLANGQACEPWPESDAEDTGDVETATDESLSAKLSLSDVHLLGIRSRRRRGLSPLDPAEIEADVRAHHEAIRGAVLGEVPAADTPLRRRARALGLARQGDWAEARRTLAEDDPEMTWLSARAEVPGAGSEAEIAGRASLLMLDLAASFLYGLSDQSNG